MSIQTHPVMDISIKTNGSSEEGKGVGRGANWRRGSGSWFVWNAASGS